VGADNIRTGLAGEGIQGDGGTKLLFEISKLRIFAVNSDV